MNINIETNTTQVLTTEQVDELAKHLCGVKLTYADSGIPTVDVDSVSLLGINAITTSTYKDAVDALAEKGINVTYNVEYIRILDPAVMAVLAANNIGDGTGITSYNAANASIGELFKNNTDIRSFDEYKFFTAQNASSSPRADFTGCTNLERIDLSNATVCPKFSNCSSLKYFHGPSSQEGVLILGNITSIPSLGLTGCTSITDLYMNSAISTSSNSMPSINNVYVPDIETWLNCSFGTNGTPIGGSSHLYANGVEVTTVTIPNTATSIKSSAFKNLRSLTSVTILGTIGEILYLAFSGCSNLASINIPEGLTAISGDAFRNCQSLSSITLPSTVTSISSYAFRSCSALSSITIKATNPPTIGTGAFQDTNNCPIRVPVSSVTTYQSDWSGYASRIQAIPTT